MLKTFEVDITRSSQALVYELNDGFWKLFEGSLIENGCLTAHVSVNKLSGGFNLLLEIQGYVALVCDRSLKPFHYPIHINKEVVFKIGGETKELSEDLYVIHEQTTSINIAQHLYDFICLAVPMKKIHPDLEEDVPYSMTF